MPDVKPSTAASQEVEPVEALYEADYFAWIQQQTLLLQAQQWNDIDLPNLIEELESLGKQQRQEMLSCLSILLAHLLKWEYQSHKRSRSWLATIRVQRRDLLRLIQDSPSLKPYLEDAILSAYVNAKDLAMGETDLPSATFPESCPYRWSQITDTQFYPGEPDGLTQEEKKTL